MKKIIVLLIILVFTFSIIGTVSEGKNIRKLDKPILLKSRHLTESVNTPEPAAKGRGLFAASSAFFPGHYIVQFDRVLTNEDKEKLKERGIKVLDYIPENAWFAYVENSAELDKFGMAYFEKIKPGDKISQNIRLDNAEIDVMVSFFGDVKDEEGVNTLEKYGRIIRRDGSRFLLKIKTEFISQLASEDGVKWIEPEPPTKMMLNDGSRSVAGADAVQANPYNLTGVNVTLAMWDAGHANHSDYNSRRIVGDTASDSDHSTHVAGTMLGNGNLSQFRGGTAFQWKGMAPNATLATYEWPDSLTELRTETNDSVGNKGAILSQNSWGWDVHRNTSDSNCSMLGDYDSWSQEYDKMIRGSDIVKPVIVVFAAGNERYTATDPNGNRYCGYYGYIYNTTIGPGGTAKNTITVGAVDKSQNMASFSSWGPTDDGRIKPDVVAVGVNVISTWTGDTYATSDGTSMASPAVSGIIGLMEESYRSTHNNANITPSTAKAILIHTAKDLNNTGPDYTTGWGLVNATAAIDKIGADTNSSDIIVEGNLSAGENRSYYMYVPVGQSNLKITLVWTDYQGDPVVARQLVNDLDLLVYNSTNTQFYPWTLNVSNPTALAVRIQADDLNNAEEVYVSNPNTGVWRIVVNGTNIPQSPQSYSLVTDFDTGNPLVELNSPADGYISSSYNVSFNCSASDGSGLSNITLYTNTTGSWGPNSTRNVTGTSNSSAWNLTLQEGMYIWNCVAYDNTSNAGWVSTNRTVGVAIPPVWSNNQTNITSIYSSNTLSFFNITWTDSALISVLLESNFSGNATNYTMYNTSSINYTFNATLPAGTLYWKSYGIDVFGNINATDTWTFAIEKANSTLQILFNGTEGNYSMNEDTHVNITTYAQSGGLISLYANNSFYVNGTGRTETITIASQPGLYNITAILGETQNYTSNRTTYWLEVNDTTAPQLDMVTSYPRRALLGENVTILASVSDNVGVSAVWYNLSNETFSVLGFMVNTSLTEYTMTYNTTNLSLGKIYNITVYANDTSNNTDNNMADMLLIAPPVNLSLSFLNSQNQSTNLTFELWYTEFSATRNESSNISGINLTLPGGTFCEMVLQSDFNMSILANITNHTTGYMNLDYNISAENLSSPGIRVFVKAVAAQINLNFSSVRIEFVYNDSAFISENRSTVLACHQWNMSNRSCYGNWTNIMANSTINRTSNRVVLNATNLSAFAIAENYTCGDGLVDTGEQCDGTNLSGQTCTSRGYSGGTLSCSASCAFVTSSCTSGGGTTTSTGGGGGGVAVTNATKNATANVTGCIENGKKCIGNGSYICMNKSWKLNASCIYGCLDGVCKNPLCLPSELRCNNNAVEVCLGGIDWVLKERCSYKCGGNKCVEAPATSPLGAFFGLNLSGSTVLFVISVVVIIIVLLGVYFKTKKPKRGKTKRKRTAL